MSTTPKNGGPAFPLREEFHDHTGMTLRDWFAGQALAGLSVDNLWSDEVAKVVALAYQTADAMIAARGEEQNS